MFGCVTSSSSHQLMGTKMADVILFCTYLIHVNFFFFHCNYLLQAQNWSLECFFFKNNRSSWFMSYFSFTVGCLIDHFITVIWLIIIWYYFLNFRNSYLFRNKFFIWSLCACCIWFPDILCLLHLKCHLWICFQVESSQTMIRILGLSATLPNYLEVVLCTSLCTAVTLLISIRKIFTFWICCAFVYLRRLRSFSG